MIECSCRFATYTASEEEWLELADTFEQSGEKRLAKTIRAGVRRVKNRGRWFSYIPLRFRDGSITKMDQVLRDQLGLEDSSS